nr:hypothetical protein [Tanacetum cinerariifolium]
GLAARYCLSPGAAFPVAGRRRPLRIEPSAQPGARPVRGAADSLGASQRTGRSSRSRDDAGAGEVSPRAPRAAGYPGGHLQHRQRKCKPPKN